MLLLKRVVCIEGNGTNPDYLVNLILTENEGPNRWYWDSARLLGESCVTKHEGPHRKNNFRKSRNRFLVHSGGVGEHGPST